MRQLALDLHQLLSNIQKICRIVSFSLSNSFVQVSNYLRTVLENSEGLNSFKYFQTVCFNLS